MSNIEKFDPSDLLNKLNEISIDSPYKSKLTLPTLDGAENIFLLARSLMFGSLYSPRREPASDTEPAEQLSQLLFNSSKEYFSEPEARHLADEIINRLPEIKSGLFKDAIAIYKGDPAARSVEEVVICYPGFLAITAYRIAHLLYERNIPYLPRMIGEYAHRMTGIDIHPGARIGDSLCIDHGTGTVIGETAKIGDRVKIYQGVTLGAKSIASGVSDRADREGKRHPTIGNDCIIYAGATILGGDTVIGDGSVIGGNVWLTHSVAPNSRVYYNEDSAVLINKK